MTTRGMISEWFDRGVADGAKHMLVICDTFDHDDYPVFTKTDFDCLLKYKNPGEMQRVIQVIETTLAVRGKGVDGDPIRRITQYWTLDGTLPAEVDPLQQLTRLAQEG